MVCRGNFMYNYAVVAIRRQSANWTSWWEVRMAARIKQAGTRYQKGALMRYIFRNTSRVLLLFKVGYHAKSEVQYRCDA